jgi:uncharacterized membrane protein YdjX (TVP38/TMEM64 family)
MSDSIETSSRAKSITTLIVTILVMALVVFIVIDQISNVKNFILSTGPFGLLVSVLLYAILGASPIPSEPFTVLITSIYGPLNATLVASSGNILSSLVEYFIGERIRNVANFDKQRTKMPFGLGKFPVNSPIFLISARAIPGYGPKFVSVISGIYRVPIWRYIWTTAITTIAGAVIVAYGGFGIMNLPFIHH